jgi:GH24 family phage-related lysozyme (muramidase)
VARQDDIDQTFYLRRRTNVHNQCSPHLGLIGQHEGFRFEAYRDPTGIWTTGYGSYQRLRNSDVITHIERPLACAPQLVWADNMRRGDVRRAIRLATEQQVSLLVRWSGLHERTD